MDSYYLIQQLINGLTLGAIYGLVAIGYTMVYGIIGMINFAHGEIFMIGSFHALIIFLILGSFGLVWLPLALTIALIVPAFLTSLYGFATEKIAYRPLRGSPRLSALISAIGLSVFLQNYVQISHGARSHILAPQITGSFTLATSPEGFSVQVNSMQVIIVVITALLMAGFYLVNLAY